MSDINIEHWQQPVWRVTCDPCDHQSPLLLDYDDAARIRAEHRERHAGQCEATSHGLRCERSPNHAGRRHTVTHTWDDTPPEPAPAQQRTEISCTQARTERAWSPVTRATATAIGFTVSPSA